MVMCREGEWTDQRNTRGGHGLVIQVLCEECRQMSACRTGLLPNGNDQTTKWLSTWKKSLPIPIEISAFAC